LERAPIRLGYSPAGNDVFFRQADRQSCGLCILKEINTSTNFAESLPDRYQVLDAVPRTSTGKFWNLKLRERLSNRLQIFRVSFAQPARKSLAHR
jgi:hypothetical protein